MSFPESVYTQFFTLNPNFIVSGSSLAFPDKKKTEKKIMASLHVKKGEFVGGLPPSNSPHVIGTEIIFFLFRVFLFREGQTRP